MKKISVKLALVFISLMLISSVLSMAAWVYFSPGLVREISQSQAVMARHILELEAGTDLELREIARIATNPVYGVRVLEAQEVQQLSDQEREALARDEMVFLSYSKLRGLKTILRIDDALVEINMHPNQTVFRIMASRMWFSVLAYIAIGSLLIALVVNRLVKPILNLTGATQEVAKGNFDVQLPVKSDDEIGQLTVNFNRMTRELKSIDYLRKDFVSNVSHEFQTPMASIQGFAQLLQEPDLSDEERRDYAGIIVEETARLSQLSSNILRLSRLEHQDMTGKETVFSLDEQIRRSILLLAHQWEEKQLELDIDLQKTQCRGNEEMLQQVWLNLLGNAIKFSHVGGEITIRLCVSADTAKVTITDNGAGMDDETLARAFEKFYQGDKARSRAGSGLGLSLVKRILDSSGGSIHVCSRTGEGASFTVRLPLSPPGS